MRHVYIYSFSLYVLCIFYVNLMNLFVYQYQIRSNVGIAILKFIGTQKKKKS